MIVGKFTLNPHALAARLCKTDVLRMLPTIDRQDIVDIYVFDNTRNYRERLCTVRVRLRRGDNRYAVIPLDLSRLDFSKVRVVFAQHAHVSRDKSFIITDRKYSLVMIAAFQHVCGLTSVCIFYYTLIFELV